MYKWLEEWKRPGALMKALFFIGIIGIIAVPAWFQNIRNHPLKWYKQKWCERQAGAADAPMPDRTACGCLTDTHTVEFAFADAWYEAVGQVLYNSMQTGKKAGIVLIAENEADKKYRHRLEETVRKFQLPIDIWVIDR
ncbi:hypothetical protein DENIS_3696 [Desulfonema ishimotonii]|uniref:Uncharacterized protein n=1 Tax=Desulfonema ishimotonii TaxID=45657 RepID=A0A401G0G5_9BACT|nr:hypothetical protein [Desulfonema ishimotonii]GBC62719.1 hypothetical protein DENIS_3696 [Desulfonema ishimotonii]